ncbi:hypothetical protein [Pseudoalteromonas denitrificans]|uniref:Uncharacterized protein n=1 Tax=Pseudoalteromonas denitrificans DSM 6059 TaxID=1123010 RepID=A0A1I1I771_9GAMM|nr:hypothetical protein [Pseudoalteromonas denitrificans]SFC32259.1 hypothetical protein SAMN02745724_01420 [Pseudoalteromonas denitrificans DSM 6059]
MKHLIKVLLITTWITACSDQAELKASNTNTPISKKIINENYAQPTFVGASEEEQLNLLKKLNLSKQPDNEQIRKKLLIELALFSNSDLQTALKLERITEKLEQFARVNQQDFEILAAYGNALSYQAIFHQDNLGKMNLLSRKGMRIMDRAIKEAPNNLGARLLRGISYANMPAFLNRSRFASVDLTLVKQYSTPKKNDAFTDFINYYLAMALAKNEEIKQAKKIWLALKNNPNSLWRDKASRRLKEVDNAFSL